MKHIDVRYIRPKRSYPINELAKLYKIHPNTILSWVHNEGLRLIDELTPFFIYGAHLLTFLRHRQSKNKCELSPLEIRCLKCRAGRVPIYSTIVVNERTYTGKCSKCHTRMSRIISRSRGQELKRLISSKMLEARLSESELLHLDHQIKEPEYMATFNAQNERVKWEYLEYEKHANSKCLKTLDKIRKQLTRYEEFTEYKSFKAFDRHIATAFKEHLIGSQGKSGEPLKLPTINHTLCSLQTFLKWLACQTGYKTAIKFTDIDYLNLNLRDRQKIAPVRLKEYPSLAEIELVIDSIHPLDEIQMRNRAMIACLIATGVRDGALIGLKLKHIDISRRHLIQDPVDVETKFGKLINTKFFPVGDKYHQILIHWVKHLRETKLFNETAPLFPREGLNHDGSYGIKRGFLTPSHWKTAGRARKIVKEAFRACGLKPYSPHRFRDTLADLGRKVCTTPDEQMAWAQNLGHKHFATTFGVYGNLTPERQFELIDAFCKDKKDARRLAEMDEDKLASLIAENVLTRLKEKSGG